MVDEIHGSIKPQPRRADNSFPGFRLEMDRLRGEGELDVLRVEPLLDLQV
jgi:hypothetical protein